MIEAFKGIMPTIDKESFVHKDTTVIGKAKIGKKVSIWPGVVIRGDEAEIEVGELSNIQDNSVLHCGEDVPTIIGKYVTVGHKCILHSCKVEDFCLIGMGATVLDGAVIGEGSVVGAGALVTRNTVIPPNSLVLGIPAKVVKQLDEKAMEKQKAHATHYWELAKNYL